MGTITVSNLGKAYKHYPTRWSRLREWVTPSQKIFHELRWVLKDINFAITAGEAVGIVGLNGAGKSTLLKIITGTTQSTTGSVQIDGRVAAMLELGMGFHPDFTGRQNVFLAGQLSGLGASEIATLMPEIEAFAEIDDYIDQPVRVYSSGMQMRLAFSVATAVRPDILIIDEALSVGDAYFHHKSLEKIKRFASEGTTILLVSHDSTVIRSLCTRAILLEHGSVRSDGDPEVVLDLYNALLPRTGQLNVTQSKQVGGKLATESGTYEAMIIDVYMKTSSGDCGSTILTGDHVSIHVKTTTQTNIQKLILGYAIRDKYGNCVFGTNTHYLGKVITFIEKDKQVEYVISFCNILGPGTYSLQLALTDGPSHLVNNYHWVDRALIFHVENLRYPEFTGALWLEHELIAAKH
jgi:lipopolysaccharide transport system ATP-binding protein